MKPNLNRKRGKQAERVISKQLGGKRTGILTGEDIHFDAPFSCEVKSRKTFVASTWFDQARRNAKGKTPILVVHVHGKNHDNDFVIMSLKDFKEWFGDKLI